jgi:hypothetical protein
VRPPTLQRAIGRNASDACSPSERSTRPHSFLRAVSPIVQVQSASNFNILVNKSNVRYMLTKQNIVPILIAITIPHLNRDETSHGTIRI